MIPLVAGHNVTFALFVEVVFSLACDRSLNILHPDDKLPANCFQWSKNDFHVEGATSTRYLNQNRISRVAEFDTPSDKSTGILGSTKPLNLVSLRHLDQRWDSPRQVLQVLFYLKQFVPKF
ncbi:MAG: hypothetical protein V7K97_20700 [Nostoc sp.]|uniref:hypothetical protein n=1 Tax=Nostoc sp. TaxID=1180 RepID=UPI002FF9A6DC